MNSLGHCLAKYPFVFSAANNAISLLSILFPIASIFRDIIFALELISKVNSGYHFRVKVERLKGFHSFLLYQGSMIIKHVSLAVFLMLNAFIDVFKGAYNRERK